MDLFYILIPNTYNRMRFLATILFRMIWVNDK